MAKILPLLCIVVLQTLFLTNVCAQIGIQNIPCAPQIGNAAYNQPMINTLLSTYRTPMPFVDKIGAIAAVIQKMPPRNPGRTNQRQVIMAETLKKSALESLMFAANACKCSQKAESRMPLPLQQRAFGNDVMANRAVNVKYDRYG